MLDGPLTKCFRSLTVVKPKLCYWMESKVFQDCQISLYLSTDRLVKSWRPYVCCNVTVFFSYDQVYFYKPHDSSWSLIKLISNAMVFVLGEVKKKVINQQIPHTKTQNLWIYELKVFSLLLQVALTNVQAHSTITEQNVLMLDMWKYRHGSTSFPCTLTLSTALYRPDWEQLAKL